MIVRNLSFCCLLIWSLSIIGASEQLHAHSTAGAQPSSVSTNSVPATALFQIRQREKHGYINRAGKVLIHPQFDGSGPFSEGLAAIRQDGKWGYIDELGAIVIQPQYTWAFPFSQGLAAVNASDSEVGEEARWCFVDRKGSVVIDGPFRDANSFSEGFACVKDPSNRTVFIDRKGRIVISEDFVRSAESFSGGLATFRSTKFRRWGCFNKEGTVVIGPLETGWLRRFSEGLASITKGNLLFGYIDTMGKLTIPYRFLWAEPFSEGVASASVSGQGHGYIDKTGVFKIAPRKEFQIAWGFSEGLAAVGSFGEPGRWHVLRWGFIDKKGEFVIEPQFEWVSSFQNGLARVSPDPPPSLPMAVHQTEDRGVQASLACSYGYLLDKMRIGYIGRTGKYVWEPTK